jgi:hypothetical protein
MEKEKPAARGITKNDIDAQGNVVLWDLGPSEPGPLVEKDSDEYKRLEAEAKAWDARNGEGSVPITMNQSDATHAMLADPERYSLDPDVNEADVEAEIEKIQDQRAKDKKTAEDREAAVQLAADRKIAVATVQAKRRSELAEAKAPKPKTAQNFAKPVKTDAEKEAERKADEANRYRVEQQLLSDEQAERDRKAAIAAAQAKSQVT